MNTLTQQVNYKILRQFGVTLGGICVVLFGVLLPYLVGKEWPLWPWACSSSLWLIAFVHPKGLKHFYISWMKLGRILGTCNSYMLLTIFYFTILTPTGLLIRIFKKDPLGCKYNNQVDTYRIPCSKRHCNHLERPF